MRFLLLTHSGTHKNNRPPQISGDLTFSVATALTPGSGNSARISGPADDELGPDCQSADGIVIFATELLGAVAPAMNCVSSLVGIVCNNFGVVRRQMFQSKQPVESPVVMDNEPEDRRSFYLSAHHTRFRAVLHDYPTTIRMHSVVPSCLMYDESAESDKNNTSSGTHQSTVPWDFYHNFTRLRQQTVLLQE